MGWIADGQDRPGRHVQRQPADDGGDAATLTEILTPDGLRRVRPAGGDPRGRLRQRHRAHRHRPATPRCMSARGAVTYRGERVRNYRDYLEVSDELAYVNWLVQFNRGVFMAPWGKSENWTLSVQHSEQDVRRYVDNFESSERRSAYEGGRLRGARRPRRPQLHGHPRARAAPVRGADRGQGRRRELQRHLGAARNAGDEGDLPARGRVGRLGRRAGGRAPRCGGKGFGSSPSRSATRSWSTRGSPAACAICAPRARSTSAASS